MLLTELGGRALYTSLPNIAVLASLRSCMSVVLQSTFCVTLPVFCPSILSSLEEVNQQEGMGGQGDIDGPSLMNLHVQSYGLGAGLIMCAFILIALLIWACCCLRQYCACLQCPLAPPPARMQTAGFSAGGMGGGMFPSAPPPANPTFALQTSSNLPDIVPTVGRPRVSVDQNLFRLITEDSKVQK